LEDVSGKFRESGPDLLTPVSNHFTFVSRHTDDKSLAENMKIYHRHHENIVTYICALQCMAPSGSFN